MNNERHEARLKSFKNGIDQEEGRRRREETHLNIRKQKKNEQLSKRRFESRNDSSETEPPLNAEGIKKTPTVEDLPLLIAAIRSTTGPAELLVDATRSIRKMLSVTCNPPVKEVVDAGALPYLVELLMRTDSHSLQFEAAWALTNVASTNFTSSVADQEHAIQYLINLLRSPSAEVREQSAWCLGNIAGDGPSYRDILLELGALEPLLLNVQQPDNDSLLGNVTWTISNLCRGKPQPNLATVYAAIPALNYLVCNSTSDDIVTDALWALSYISDGEDARIDAIITADPGITRKLVQLVDSGKAQVIAPALRVLGNFVSGNEEQTQAVIDAGVLSVALNIITGPKKNLRKEMCWLLSNIAAGTQKQITTLTTTKHLAEQLVMLSVQAEWETRKEAIWAVSNIFTGGSDHCVSLLVNQKGIDAMVAALDDTREQRMTLVALDAIDNILTVGERNGYRYSILLDECGGLEKLEALQQHSDNAVYEKALEIIDRYFGEEEAEDENLAPTYNGDNFVFGVSSPPPAKILFDSPDNTPSTFGSVNNFNFGR